MADKVEYPKWRYHDKQAAFVVESKEEHETLTPDSEGWRSTPKGSQNDQDDVHAEADVPVVELVAVEPDSEDEESESVSEVEASETDESSEPIKTGQEPEGNVAGDSETGELSFAPEDGDQY